MQQLTAAPIAQRLSVPASAVPLTVSTTCPAELPMRGDSIVTSRLRELFGETVSIREKRGVGGGCINQTSILLLDNGVKLFLKENSASYAGMFEAEAAGLRALAVESGPAVPKPFGVVEGDGRQYLFLEFIDSGRQRSDFWEDFGRRLAALHRDSRSDRFGFDVDNYIGATPQKNRWEASWPEFFSRHRIGAQLALARRNGYASEPWFAEAEELTTRLAELLRRPERASLLHGDLWGGNYMVGAEGGAVLIDPAVYYGDREADLAMTELFGGFAGRFYDAYREAYPLEPGYHERRDLYNLYHLLNHLNLFGGSYGASVASVIARYR